MKINIFPSIFYFFLFKEIFELTKTHRVLYIMLNKISKIIFSKYRIVTYYWTKERWKILLYKTIHSMKKCNMSLWVTGCVVPCVGFCDWWVVSSLTARLWLVDCFLSYWASVIGGLLPLLQGVCDWWIVSSLTVRASVIGGLLPLLLCVCDWWIVSSLTATGHLWLVLVSSITVLAALTLPSCW